MLNTKFLAEQVKPFFPDYTYSSGTKYSVVLEKHQLLILNKVGKERRPWLWGCYSGDPPHLREMIPPLVSSSQ
jgi:hypothetical protein